MNNLKYPKLVFLILGVLILLIGFTPAFIMADREIKSKEKTIEEQKTVIAKLEFTNVNLSYENKQLMQKTKTYKLIKPNGEIIEKTESELESKTEISKEMKLEYKSAIETNQRKFTKELEKIIKERKKFTGEVGVNQNLMKYGHINYQFMAPFSIGIRYTEGVGFSFGVGFTL